MRRSTIAAFAVLSVLLLPAQRALAEHRIGGGVEYLHTLGDIKDTEEFDEKAFGLIASYQYNAHLLKIEADVEWIPDFGGLDEALIQPQAYLLIGGLIYGGAGIGIGYFDGKWQEDPFYALRAGVDLSLGGLDLDIFGVYRFQKTEVLEDLGESDLDAIMFSALLRFGFGG